MSPTQSTPYHSLAVASSRTRAVMAGHCHASHSLSVRRRKPGLCVLVSLGALSVSGSGDWICQWGYSIERIVFGSLTLVGRSCCLEMSAWSEGEGLAHFQSVLRMGFFYTNQCPSVVDFFPATLPISYISQDTHIEDTLGLPRLPPKQQSRGRRTERDRGHSPSGTNLEI